MNDLSPSPIGGEIFIDNLGPKTYETLRGGKCSRLFGGGCWEEICHKDEVFEEDTCSNS